MKFVLSIILASLSVSVLADRCRVSKTIEHEFPAKNFSALKFSALAGELEVTGEITDTIRVVGKACTSEAEYLDRMKIDVDDDGDVLDLIVIIPYQDFSWHADYAHMDIEITVPVSLATELLDSSGNILVRDATITGINDSSGHIRINNVRGDLTLKDSSGDITLTGLEGNVTISDSSGSLDIQDIEGDVFIPRDSSGDIDVDNVSGKVIVERDSSGEIEIRNVGKDVEIHNDSSGDIYVSKVQGSVSIGSDGSGRVRISHVKGDFELLNKGSGEIRTSSIAGSISVPR